MPLQNDATKHLTITVPVDRGRALLRGVLWGMPSVLLGVLTAVIYPSLTFVPSGVSNRLVDYGIAVLALPIPLVALACAVRAIRWLMMGAWPGPVGVFAFQGGLEFRLGPSRRRYDAARLDIRYPFELDDESGEAAFEAHLPEEEQMRKFLPRMTHPEAMEPVNRLILRVARGSEEEIVTQLSAIIIRWRSARSGKEEARSQSS